MLPSKSPTSQSPFLLSQSGRSHDGTGGVGEGKGAGMQSGGMDVEEGDSPTSALSPNLHSTGTGTNAAQQSGPGGTSGGGGAGTGPAAAPGGSTATAASKVERYRPRIFGFPTHETAKLHRWQERQRDQQIQRLERAEAGSPVGVDPDAGKFKIRDFSKPAIDINSFDKGVGAGLRTAVGPLD
jgi:casein kinase II subunit beta